MGQSLSRAEQVQRVEDAWLSFVGSRTRLLHFTVELKARCWRAAVHDTQKTEL